MKTDKLVEELKIPESVEVNVDGRSVMVKGPKGENKREFKFISVKARTDGDKVVLETTDTKKKQKKNINTMKAHIANMFEGVLNGFKYTLKICSGHFPMNVSMNGKEFIVKNFLGEKIPRVLKLKEGADVKIDGQEIVVESIDKEIAGQVAADIEQLTRVTNKDIRIFQDGIYIIEKPKRQ